MLTTNPKCILVLSMHRSGSSCCSGSMQFLGTPIGYGNHHMLEKNQWNAKGFFENELIWKLNVKVLKAVKGSWKNVRNWTAAELKIIQSFLPELVGILKNDYLSQPEQIFLIKDPRILWLWELYTAALNELNIELYTVCIDRDNVEVSKSLWDPHRVPFNDAMKLTLDHKNKIIENTKNIPTDHVYNTTYKELLNSPTAVLEGVCNLLKVSPDLINRKGISNFIDKKLKHY
jgi:hypothetical protein